MLPNPFLANCFQLCALSLDVFGLIGSLPTEQRQASLKCIHLVQTKQTDSHQTKIMMIMGSLLDDGCDML